MTSSARAARGPRGPRMLRAAARSRRTRTWANRKRMANLLERWTAGKERAPGEDQNQGPRSLEEVRGQYALRPPGGQARPGRNASRKSPRARLARLTPTPHTTLRGR